jgi:hypothetical protein
MLKSAGAIGHLGKEDDITACHLRYESVYSRDQYWQQKATSHATFNLRAEEDVLSSDDISTVAPREFRSQPFSEQGKAEQSAWWAVIALLNDYEPNGTKLLLSNR